MLGFYLVLRDPGLLTIEKRPQTNTETGIAVGLELLDENGSDIGFTYFISLRQRLATIFKCGSRMSGF